MPVRPPQASSADSPFRASLDYEIAQEKAAALGRVGRRLEAALAALAAFDSASPPGPPSARDALVAEAAEALWLVAVQREALGLSSVAALLRDYAVPPEVAARMGAAAPSAR